jgi:hypothetical protein
MVRKLRNYMDEDRKAQLRDYKAIKRVLAKLRHKRDHLQRQLAGTHSAEEKARLQRKLLLVTEQRRKGLKILGELRATRREKG